ncbi:MAG TPA: 2'-deoxycytidine 5'-triphosphate deaminase [Azospirillaceae bacterium]|nr:2'-deoxycytidine 5'-triphosphate deaminase [Azospirillaceae bacterium]
MTHPSAEPERSAGVLPSQALRAAIADGQITGLQAIGEDQIQPASLDLRLGEVAYRVRASFLPGPRATVREKIDAFKLYQIDLTAGAVLEQDCVYIVPLLEGLNLKRRVTALANPKSSAGRLDVFARVITDHGAEFDQIRDGYSGPLYAEISPRSFPVKVRTGTRLTQLRLRKGTASFSDTALRRLQDEAKLVTGDAAQDYVKGGRVAFTVDLAGTGGGEIVGWKARRNAGLVDFDLVGHYDPADFWDPVHAHPGGIVLNPNDFYILASKEAVSVPADHAAEMLAYDALVGEFRVHYAGFFDPGFGTAEGGGQGSRAVLEVRARDVPFIIEDGQMVGRLVYERLTTRPDKLYGSGISSNYQGQSLKLGKQFQTPA